MCVSRNEDILIKLKYIRYISKCTGVNPFRIHTIKKETLYQSLNRKNEHFRVFNQSPEV